MKALLPAALLALTLTACATTPGEGDAADGRVHVVTTVNMITDLASQIGGDRVRVTGLMGPGVDPHLYKASAGDVRRLANADLVLYGGLHLEGKMVDILHSLNARVPSVAVSEVIPEDRLLTLSGAHDPHVWFDPTLWADAARATEEALSRVDPAGRAVYEANLNRYLGQLRELDAWTAEQFRTVPARQRVLVTAHDAFGYLSRRYGVEVRGLQGISTVAEAGGQNVRSLATFLAERNVKAVFVESTVSPRAVQAVREAARARGHDVEIGGELYADAAGERGTPEGTYVGMVRHNIETIVEALK
ncbi:metal ABC transporter solute-binding protein, Zn/Mn family [Deinococcus planocerae]|uniref:metal ABC transporter solute-binding protein, Zn/Mn family n=1 Tax=Deinococcus planocerae TaxID=1737569 RepID=UPI000C7EA483|nr:zinc ABC transporter substrate-binding protein [Deinococcus planocerae]